MAAVRHRHRHRTDHGGGVKPAVQRTPGEALRELTDLFDLAARQWKDIMEPYVNRLADAADDAERTEIMRAGLRETID